MLSPVSDYQPLTLEQGMADFKAVYMPARNYSNRTREEYDSDLQDLARFLEGRNIASWLAVGLRDLQAYMADLDYRGLAPASRNRKTYSIKTLFAFLYQSGHLKKNVSAELIPPTIPHKDRRFLTEDEYQRVLANIHSIRDRAVLELFLQTGLRLSELVTLNTSDLELPKRVTRDPENVGMIRVHRKRGKEVYLPLNWKACEALAAWLTARRELIAEGGTDDALFCLQVSPAHDAQIGALPGNEVSAAGGDTRRIGAYSTPYDGDALLSEGWRFKVGAGDVGTRSTPVELE